MTAKARSTPIIQQLGSAFYDEVQAASFPQEILRYKNGAAAKFLDLPLSDKDWAKYFHRFEAYTENLEKPLALRYHGHQFRHYNPDLGDGRGFLYAQFRGADGKIYDLGTKGSGQTPYSRSGDGRLTLKGAVREALATEMLESLGVNTSRTFCFFETGENLERGDEPSPTRSAVLTRMSYSHLRIGTFQRLAFLGEKENLIRLVDYSVQNYFPELLQRANKSTPELAVLFFRQVMENLAKLVAEYMLAGFVHGVLNSDNLNITGESFDYGPYRFLPHYDQDFTAAYFDSNGLYSYGRQPLAFHWCLKQLGHTLQFAYLDFPTDEVLADFADIFNEHSQKIFFKRLNLIPRSDDVNTKLMLELFTFLEKTKAPFEQVFFDLHSFNEARLQNSPLNKIYVSEDFTPLKEAFASFEIADFKLAQHDYFKNKLPCTLLIDEIESLWSPIAEKDDWSIFNKKIEQIRSFRNIY